MLFKKDGTEFEFVRELFYIPKEEILVVRMLGKIHIDTGYELTDYFSRNEVLEKPLYGMEIPQWYSLEEFVSIYALVPFMTNDVGEEAEIIAFKELLILYRGTTSALREIARNTLKYAYLEYVDIMGKPAPYSSF